MKLDARETGERRDSGDVAMSKLEANGTLELEEQKMEYETVMSKLMLNRDAENKLGTFREQRIDLEYETVMLKLRLVELEAMTKLELQEQKMGYEIALSKLKLGLDVKAAKNKLALLHKQKMEYEHLTSKLKLHLRDLNSPTVDYNREHGKVITQDEQQSGGEGREQSGGQDREQSGGEQREKLQREDSKQSERENRKQSGGEGCNQSAGEGPKQSGGQGRNQLKGEDQSGGESSWSGTQSEGASGCSEAQTEGEGSCKVPQKVKSFPAIPSKTGKRKREPEPELDNADSPLKSPPTGNASSPNRQKLQKVRQKGVESVKPILRPADEFFLKQADFEAAINGFKVRLQVPSSRRVKLIKDRLLQAGLYHYATCDMKRARMDILMTIAADVLAITKEGIQVQKHNEAHLISDEQISQFWRFPDLSEFPEPYRSQQSYSIVPASDDEWTEFVKPCQTDPTGYLANSASHKLLFPEAAKEFVKIVQERLLMQKSRSTVGRKDLRVVIDLLKGAVHPVIILKHSMNIHWKRMKAADEAPAGCIVGNVMATIVEGILYNEGAVQIHMHNASKQRVI